MTLRGQLWLTIVALMIASFVGSFLVSNLSSRSYLEEQLYLKNADNATTLALTLSNAGDDHTARELLLSAQFDSGHYAYIHWQNTDGDVQLGTPGGEPVEGVPAWLIRLFPIDPQPGVAQVSQGWQTAGTITLQSAHGFAYRELWRNTQRLFEYFSAAAFLACLFGTLLLRWITSPLGSVVAQAQAIGQRRFITVAEPRTRELRALTQAMNGLSTRVKQMLSEESERLGNWHRESQKDPLTGLLARDFFLERFASRLKRDDASAEGVFAIVRILRLNELNRAHGRAVMDALLASFAEELQQQAELHEGLFAGRLNGSELGLVVPHRTDASDLARQLVHALTGRARAQDLNDVALALGATRYGGHDSVPGAMQRTDQALATAEQRPGGGIEIADPQYPSLVSNTRAEFEQWSERISRALEDGGLLRLETYPVRDRAGTLLHAEAFSRLRTEQGEELRAAQFVPWAARLGRMVELDLWVVGAALRRIAETRQPHAINLSVRILEEPESLNALVAQVRAAPRSAPLLWLEITEDGVYGRIDGFRSLCAALAPLGCRLGVEHAGPQIARLGALYDVGLHYVKLEAALIRSIESRPGNQAFVRGLCTIAHAIGLQALAEGVESEAEWRALLDLGIDGGTGRFFPV